MKEEKIKVLALLPMELPKEIELNNTLEAMQKFVGGLIECITYRKIPMEVCRMDNIGVQSTLYNKSIKMIHWNHSERKRLRIH